MRQVLGIVAAAFLLGAWAQPDEPGAAPSSLRLRDESREPPPAPLPGAARGDEGAASPDPAPRPARPEAGPSKGDRDSYWLREPSDQDFTDLFPKEANRKGVEGRATVRCLIGLDTRLTGCEVLSESPTGYGFGAAASALVQRARMAPAIRDGVARPTRITIPVVMRPAPPAPARLVPRPPTVAARVVDPTELEPMSSETGPNTTPAAPPRPSSPPIDWSWFPPYGLATLAGVMAFLALLSVGLWRTGRRQA
jgi:TonB family protein